jgi:hypothetical protein
MPNFQPDQVAFQDMPGYGAWDIGHYREHHQFIQVFAAQSPAVLIPDFDFLQFLTAGQARASILQTHAQAHVALRAALGITGNDLSVVNLDAQDDFYNWLGIHATEHAQMRQVLGVL